MQAYLVYLLTVLTQELQKTGNLKTINAHRLQSITWGSKELYCCYVHVPIMTSIEKAYGKNLILSEWTPRVLRGDKGAISVNFTL